MADKEKQSERISVRLSPRIKRIAEAQAALQRRTLNDFIRWVIMEEVDSK